VKVGPSIPSGYYSWGVALAKHGNLDGAAAKFKDANQKGPHWTDPLKAWGDVLVKQGKIKDALVKYDEALKYAPNWKQLKDAREAVARQKELIRLPRSGRSRMAHKGQQASFADGSVLTVAGRANSGSS
jgi:tetratricopeptide (TPR) repeat protein